MNHPMVRLVRLMPIKKTSNQNFLNQSNGLKHKTSVEKTVLRQHKNVCYTEKERSSAIANQAVPVYISDCCSSNSSRNDSQGGETNQMSDISDSTAKHGLAKQRKKRHSPKRRKSGRKIIRDFPEWLAYDGLENLYAFKYKFTKYAETLELLNCLCWSLKGKAEEFCALVQR